MRKANDIVGANLAQNLTGSFVESLVAAVVFGVEPLCLEHSPYSLGYIEMRGIRWEEIR